MAKSRKNVVSEVEGGKHSQTERSEVPGTDSQTSSNENDKGRKKKRKVDTSMDVEEHVSGESLSGDRKRKKKKKKRSKKKRKTENAIEDGSVASLESWSSDVNLEGSMVGDIMVLLDRKKNLVYSALERSDDGKRKQIGKISKSGEILLDKEDASDTDIPDTKPIFPFDTDADDHCESPVEAYQDVVPFLRDFASHNPKGSEFLTYDPYFCNGTVVRNLKSLGFPNVYNRKEDCYKVWGSSKYPEHDILVTNPPYSGDHIERLIDHITSKLFGSRPWMLLLPQWVHKKDYYVAKTKHIRPFYIVPRKRYVYLPPPSFRESKKSDVHKKSSPFVSMWYVWGGTNDRNEKWLSQISRSIQSSCDVARSKSALRDLRRKGSRK